MTQSTVGTTYFYSATGSDVVAQVFPPSSNLYGAVIRTLTGGNTPGANPVQVSLFADLIAPTGFNDVARKMVGVFVMPANTGASFLQPYELQIPPSLGFWIATRGTAGVHITYDLLTRRLDA